MFGPRIWSFFGSKPFVDEDHPGAGVSTAQGVAIPEGRRGCNAAEAAAGGSWEAWGQQKWRLTHGYGSIPINTIISGMNIHKSQLFWCEQKGYKVLTHCHIENERWTTKNCDFTRKLGGSTGWGVVCARQKWVVCARQTLVVCARYFCVILSLYLCNMILVVFFFTSSHNSSLCVFFLTSLCGVFVFRLVFRAFSSFSSCVAPPLTQLHPSCLTQCRQLISHNSSPLTTYITHLTQLISHNSTHTTHLTQLISLNSSHTTQLTQELLSCSIWWSCFRVLSLNFTQVLSQNSSHNSHNSSHTTPLISQLTQLISHNSPQPNPKWLRQVMFWIHGSHPCSQHQWCFCPPPTPPTKAYMAGTQHQCARMTALCARMTRFLCARMTRLQCAHIPT